MAELEEDGCLNVNTDVKEIVYHPALNVILIITVDGVVKVLDVNSGVILQSTAISAQSPSTIKCKYIPAIDRVLFCDGQSLGIRSDYNGVLLLDSILQTNISKGTDLIKLELPLSEAIIFRQSLTCISNRGFEHVVTELTEAITKAQKQVRKGIKAQKWNTVCLNVRLADLRLAAFNTVSNMLAKNQHIPELGVASAIQERLSELLGEKVNAADRKSMASEIRRRETFSQWPHMDYKWALPDQMAQAGFYHLPNTLGDDRAMCFTCTVCLVSWECTDEPWSEHERHSPRCPFVMGEYTQNVPSSVTMATSPAADAKYRGSSVKLVGNSSLPNLVPVANWDCLISVFDITDKINRTHSFYVSQFDSAILEQFTQDFIQLRTSLTAENKKYPIEKITSLCIMSQGPNSRLELVRPTILCGLNLICESPKASDSKISEKLDKSLVTYLVVYDFTYKKEESDANDKKIQIDDNFDKKNVDNNFDSTKTDNFEDDMNTEGYNLMKQLSSYYKSLLPNECDEILLEEVFPKKKFHTGPKILMDSGAVEISISDHISEVKNNNQVNNKKLNYSRAVQCLNIPFQCNNIPDLEVSDLIPIDWCVLVVLKSPMNNSKSYLLLYALDCTDKMVKIFDNPLKVRELSEDETPVEISLLPKNDENLENSSCTMGAILMVCADGALRILDPVGLQTVYHGKKDGEPFVSAVYCNGLDKLCCSTKSGSLHFFPFNNADDEKDKKNEEDEENFQRENFNSTETSDFFHKPIDFIPIDNLKEMKNLCEFELLKKGYSVAVPPCWNEFLQKKSTKFIQKQQQHQSIKVWRLQTNTTTYDEHIFEITLSNSISLGKIDLFFTLQSKGIIPLVEVTLLEQNTSSSKRGKIVDPKLSEYFRKFIKVYEDTDDSETIGENDSKFPLDENTSQEFLRGYNTEVLAGPIDFSSSLDLTEKNGVITLTSPKLFKKKSRNLLLHIKAIKDDETFLRNKNKKQSDKIDEVDRADKSDKADKFDKISPYIGCDVIHEISIVLYTQKNTDIGYEKIQRNLMLNSNFFLKSLLGMVTSYNHRELILNDIFDILNWIASIKLTKNGCETDLQLEFLKLVEEKLNDLLRCCILLGGRSLARKCAKLIVTCCSGADNISQSYLERFNSSVLKSLFIILENITDVNSAGGLQWIFSLLLKISTKKNEHLIAAKCVKLLESICEKITEKNNPFYLILRSRYGLYGTPMEPQLFDVDHPNFLCSKNDEKTYKENIIDPKEIFSTSSKTKFKSNSAFSRNLYGLIESEPLHFVCVESSEGTRVEKLDENEKPGESSTNLSSFFQPFLYKTQLKKEEEEMMLQNYLEVSLDNLEESGFEYVAPDALQALPVPIDLCCQKKGADSLPDSDVPFPPTPPPPPPPLSPLSLRRLLIPPPRKSIVIERMNSGARRFVILDFGKPILLTDVFFPSCSDLVLLTLDYWLKSEDVDGKTLVQVTDVGSKGLAMTDLQPETLCRYLKITVVGRYGMSTVRSRIPLGYFYGHSVILPDDIPYDVRRDENNLNLLNFSSCMKQLEILTKLFEDISCRYNLACSKLKELLRPLLLADMRNSVHLRSYMKMCRDRNDDDLEYNKVFGAYQETIRYQHQLNIIKNVISRIERNYRSSSSHLYTETCPGHPSSSSAEGNSSTHYRRKDSSENSFPTRNPVISTDKLTTIAGSILEVLLSIEASIELSRETCEKYFYGLCVSQSSRLQILAATFLDKSCGRTSFWGDFLADTLAEYFSTNFNTKCPQDRLFILLSYLSEKQVDKSGIIDATLRTTYETLTPLNSYTTKDAKNSLLAVLVDLNLLSWQLMYLSLNLKNMKSIERWDWVSGETIGDKVWDKVNDSKKNGNGMKKKNGKRVAGATLHHNLNITPGGFQVMFTTTTTPNQLATKAKLIRKKLKEELKEREPVPEKQPEQKNLIVKPQIVDNVHCLAVAKNLLRLILFMDHSSSSDMVLLSFKVISRLVTLAKLRLSDLLESDLELLHLVRFCIHCKIPWVPFALACFLQDSLEVTEDGYEAAASETEPISSWDCSRETESSSENFHYGFTSCPINSNSTPKKTANISQLPSVYESEDNSDLEDLVEDFHKIRSFNSNSSNSFSCAIDSRLEKGVEMKSEIELRKMVIKNWNILAQNLTTVNCTKGEKTIQLNPWNVATSVTSSQQTNKQMLIRCFESLFLEIEEANSEKLEQILNLWLLLNCPLNAKEPFQPSILPQIPLQSVSVQNLISTIARSPSVSITTWCLTLQILTLILNTCDSCDTIVGHQDFVRLFMNLLSGTGPDLAGPSLCRALHDILVRLQMRCNVVSSTSRLGNRLKNLLLEIIYGLTRPSGPIASYIGPLDAQCGFLRGLLYLDFSNTDLSISMSTFENTASLVHSHLVNDTRNVKCRNVSSDKNKMAPNMNTFSDIFASVVLGSDANKQDRNVSYEDLLISMLKLMGRLVQMHTLEQTKMDAFQTDESKAEQILKQESPTTSSVKSFADFVLSNRHAFITLCRCLAACKSSSLCMLANISQKAIIPGHYLGEPTTVADAVFHLLASVARMASARELLVQPLLTYLNGPQITGLPGRPLSEPFVWFIMMQVLENEEAIRTFHKAGGIVMLAKNIVSCIDSPSTLRRIGTISSVMQHFTTAKKTGTSEDESSSLINFAPFCTITCESGTAQPPDVLIQSMIGAAHSHRRARTPVWSYHFYPEEVHTELILHLPTAILLKEVQLQPHIGGLATCPSFIAIEVSSNGPNRLMPLGPPLPTSGLTFIKVDLPRPKVVNCILIRLYRPKDANSIGLLHIRVLGNQAFGVSQSQSSENEDESHCRHSLGWLRLLHHCFTLVTDEETKKEIVDCASKVENLLGTCCNLLLVPSHILPVYLPCLEKVLRELALHCPENGLSVIKALLENSGNIEPFTIFDTSWQRRRSVDDDLAAAGHRSICELLCRICDHLDPYTSYRVETILKWLGNMAKEAILNENTKHCNVAYISSVASILWSAKNNSQKHVLTYDLNALIKMELFDQILELKIRSESNLSLKNALDSILCSICYIRPEFYTILLHRMGVIKDIVEFKQSLFLRKNRILDDLTNEHLETIDSSENSVSTNEEALPSASNSPDEKSTSVCDKNVTSGLLETIPFNSGSFENVFLVQNLTRENLETIASVSRSIPTIELLINSRLPKLLNSLILKFCAKNDDNTTNVSFISSILNFFTDVCEERAMRDYLGSEEGSMFWPDLLKFLCDKDDVDAKKNNYGLQSEERVDLEEVCVRFLRKCCLCHQVNQARLGKVLCDVIRYQSSSSSSAISGFMRRLILQLLLETEKIPVSIESTEETLYKKKSCPVFYVPTHPAFKQTYNRTILYLSTNTTLLEILQQHISFNSNNFKTEESSTQTTHALLNPNNYKSEELDEEKLSSPFLKTVFFNPPEEKSATFLKKSFLKKDDIFKNCFFVCDVDDESEASFAASAAGAAAKDKRAKEAKNQQMTAASHLYSKTVKKKKIMVVSKTMDPPTTSTSATDSKKSAILPVENDDTKVVVDGRAIMCETVSDSALPLGLNLGQILGLIEKKDFKTEDGSEVDWPYVHLKVYKPKDTDKKETSPISLQDQPPICSALQVFSSFGGLALLAQHLPTIYPDAIKTTESEEKPDRRRCEVDMYKVIEDVDDIYEDVTEEMSTTSSSPPLQHVPPHSLASFGLFLRLPGYADVLLTDVKKALCLLRLVLGVVDDGEGSDIFHSPIADSLPILPFEVLRQLYDSTPLNTDLRQLSVNLGVIHLILTCLSIFTHQSENRGEKDTFGHSTSNKSKEDRSQLYWAKGTGFGTGSTEQNWNVEQALMKQKNEEEHVTVLLAVLSSYINPDGNSDEPVSGEVLPPTFHDLLAKSALLSVISSYLRNDSVLDMARHIPLYKAVLKLLRAIAGNSQLVDLLLPVKNKNSSEPSLSFLLKNMRQCVDAYASKLGISHLMKQQPTTDDPEGLATLMPDILRTAEIVSKVTASFIDAENNSDKECSMIEKKAIISIEERYMRIMKSLQFSSYDMITELPDGSIRFTISHHFESSVKNSNPNSVHPTRVKRIAQEAATLSTSLPLSYDSSVFGRYDTARLDVMKILITGPADTPYANGCFEFDAYFPTNYPASPMMINLETTGRHTVRFNPNLYNDGKVCLSVLNTWHGRPEEKWNPHTSSFLQVLVSIQSLILVPEPYFNEPGYERARGTPAGAASCREYDANVRQATVRWAMLEQLVNPSECFREVIETHFYLKRDEILSQVEKWIEESEREKKAIQRQNKKASLNNLDNFKKIYAQLKEMMLKLKPPAGLEEQQQEGEEEKSGESGGVGEAEEVEELSTTPTNDTEPTAINEVHQQEEAIEKMVVDMCDE